VPGELDYGAVVEGQVGHASLVIPHNRQRLSRQVLPQLFTDRRPNHRNVALSDYVEELPQNNQLYKVDLVTVRSVPQEAPRHPFLPGLSGDPGYVAESAGRQVFSSVRRARHTTNSMTHQFEQKRAQKTAQQRARRIAELRAALNRPRELRLEAEALLARVPESCDAVLAWSNEGHAVALVASVLADDVGRDLVAHRASTLAPLAERTSERPWTWACAEELLGVAETRDWAAQWAAERGGRRYAELVPLIALG
jgi:hypothetical protein